MGEVQVMEMEKQGSSSMVKWGNFLPKNGLRVLLVEADDSTRHIIGALLRKCSYKVATAPDGLKAWEVLKARPNSIDLILTEMELPSISGYALLTLIMEHQICKNIPVIMMSKYDTASLVYKCMMRGAADFLVKPIRINELKNLWQHVWRRQSQGNRGGQSPKEESVAQEKKEATAENNEAGDRSSGSKACSPRREDCLKKGSDAQSSCGKHDVEAESSYTAEVEDCSQPKVSSFVTKLGVQDQHKSGHSPQNLPAPEGADRHNCGPSHQNPSLPEGAAQDTAAYKGNRALDRDQRLEQQRLGVNVNLFPQASCNKMVINNSPTEAIDLIGAFGNHPKHISCLNDSANRYDSSHLDLSVTRCSPVRTENISSNENQLLNHSNASAFTLYVHKTIQASCTNATSGPILKHSRIYAGDHLSNNNATESSTSPKDSFFQYSREVVSVLTPSPSQSPSPANQQMISCNQFDDDVLGRPSYCLNDQSPRISSSQPVYRQDQKMESLEDQAQFSVNDQCVGSSSLNDTVGRLNGSEGGNEQTNGLSRQRSLQREAALNKFRLKRKERCFDKKVRYESRKKLAEQRPRVKGQFVRHLPPAPPPPKSTLSGGISVAN